LGEGTGQLFRMNWFRFLSEYDAPTSVNEETGSLIPQKFRLEQNYPNPFNPTTTISFFLSTKNNIKLTLNDILGKEIKIIAQGNYSYGEHSIDMNASDLASGVYFYKLEAGEFVDVKKLVLLK
jgi:hypothetical protein